MTETGGSTPALNLHATCVAEGGRGLLILGPSGAGKSGLALTLMAAGARLVADDRVDLHREGDRLIASCPEPLRGRIEARGVGLLAAEAYGPAPVVLAVDLGVAETERLPPRRQLMLLGLPIALVHKVESAHFPGAILQYLRGCRVD
ncbi:HPr kinase/phosphorylase [Frigidibacter oleivorans]|uniref:HPr kinase/phosphorylase n=1 Tax=Frigidibacter oleivorans TaxID=2487129 RepID=UPI001F25CCFE|nr:HPr kinase/phosphatase C-terminal domain-containing protein [Frigidibacter oleivorans]